MNYIKKISVNYIKEIAFFLINGVRRIIYLFCIIFPIEKKHIFVNCYDGRGYGDNPKYIVEKLKKMDNKVSVYWVYKGKNKLKDNNGVIYVRCFSIKAIYHQATSKIWISTVRMPFYSVKRSDQKYIQTWHGGFGLKKSENECAQALSSRYRRTAKRDSTMIDYFISSNDKNTDFFLNYFWYSEGEILKYGSPRNDIFFEKSDDISEHVKNRLGIKNAKVAVYVPTFREDGKLGCYNINYEGLRETLKETFGGEWKIVVRLHPKIAFRSSKLIRNNRDLIDGSDFHDVQEMLVASDVLITDYSSIAFDYINTRRPVFIYAVDIDEYRKDRDFRVELENTPFSIARNNDDLLDSIRNFDKEKYAVKVDNFMTKYNFYDDGTASEKVASLIYKIIN